MTELEDWGDPVLNRNQQRRREIEAEFDAARGDQACEQLIQEYLALEAEWDELTDPGHLHLRH